MTEQIKELEKALEGSLMHENECAFVHTSTIKICLNSLNAWEEVIAQLKARRDYYEKEDYGLFVEVNACISIIESLLEGVTE